MLLEKLREYSERLELAPPMYQRTPIRWLIDIDKNADFVGFAGTTSGKPGKADRGKEYLAPHIGRSSGVKAKLLADTGEYVLGLARKHKKPEKQKEHERRVTECHQKFLEQVNACATATGDPSVRAVLRFLERMKSDALPLPAEFEPSHNLTFRVKGVLPIHLKSVQEYWASVAAHEEGAEGLSAVDELECLVCGKKRPPVKRHQFKIKRIPGGQPSGMALISANVPAFESYGLEESLIAPTCQTCGERFAKAANALIEDENTHLTVGPLVYVFWTKEERGFSPARLLRDPEPDEVKALIESALTGRKAATQVDITEFYATAFSASGGRVVVRDWITTTLGEVQRRLARYFVLQRLVEWDGSEGRPYGLFALAAATTRDANQDLSPQVPRALLHVALKGGPLPLWLLSQAVKRNRAEQGITRNRAALIKMVLLSQEPDINREDAMVKLDTDNKEPAYLCGRLLAIMESVQQAAIPNAGSTVTDRFFGTASSAPASVFGRLVRSTQAHLSKLRKERRGAYEALVRRLEEVQQNLRSYPKTLTLEQQGLFGLGYYHQRATDRAAALAHKKGEVSGEE